MLLLLLLASTEAALDAPQLEKCVRGDRTAGDALLVTGRVVQPRPLRRGNITIVQPPSALWRVANAKGRRGACWAAIKATAKSQASSIKLESNAVEAQSAWEAVNARPPGASVVVQVDGGNTAAHVVAGENCSEAAKRLAASEQFSPATTWAAVFPPSTCTTTDAPGGRALTASQALCASTALLSSFMDAAWLFAVALIAFQQAPRLPFAFATRHSAEGGCTIVILPRRNGRGWTTRPVTRRASPAVRSPRTHFSNCAASRAASLETRSRRSSMALFHRSGQPAAVPLRLIASYELAHMGASFSSATSSAGLLRAARLPVASL